MMSLNVQIPDALVPMLEKRASEEGKQPEAVVVEIVAKELNATVATKPATERERVISALKEAGLLVTVSDDLKKRIIPDVTHAEVREALAHAGGQPLSEIVIEQRGPKV